VASDGNRTPRAGQVGDLDAIPAYREASEVAALVHALEDRFPDDQIQRLYGFLRSSVLALGARIAEGYGRDGLDERGLLSEETRRLARGELYGVRHYVAVSGAQFYLDEDQVRALDVLCGRVEAALSSPAGSAAGERRGAGDE
jgi:hypothetical protein